MQTLKKYKKAVVVIALLGFAYTLLALPNHHSLAAPPPAPPPARGGPALPAGNLQDSDCPSHHVDPSDPTKCAPLGNDCKSTDTSDACLKKSPVIQFLDDIILFLSAVVGIVVIGTIILGGIQYSMAGGSSGATQAAKTRITNGLIALLAYVFILAFLNWLIPGGL